MKYITKRLGFYLIAFIAAITLNFFLPRLMPGDPVQMYLAELYESGGRIDEATIRAVEELFGFNTNEPLIVSYFKYVKNIFTGSRRRLIQRSLNACRQGGICDPHPTSMY